MQISNIFLRLYYEDVKILVGQNCKSISNKTTLFPISIFSISCSVYYSCQVMNLIFIMHIKIQTGGNKQLSIAYFEVFNMVQTSSNKKISNWLRINLITQVILETSFQHFFFIMIMQYSYLNLYTANTVEFPLVYKTFRKLFLKLCFFSVFIAFFNEKSTLVLIHLLLIELRYRSCFSLLRPKSKTYFWITFPNLSQFIIPTISPGGGP